MRTHLQHRSVNGNYLILWKVLQRNFNTAVSRMARSCHMLAISVHPK